MLLKKTYFIYLTLILLGLFFVPAVQSQNNLDFQIVEVTLDGYADLDFQGSSSRLDYFTADLKLFPRDSYREDVIEFNLWHEPGASVLRKNNIEYKWDEGAERLEFGYESRIKTWNRVFNIPHNPDINFHVSRENSKYLKETEFIDITPEIRQKAFDIVEGSEGIYDATFNIAEWIRTNVNYDLNTLTEEVVQKSSWVLENRFGVCDEITNLFVSFMRSLNIPTRYVVGIAYSDAVDEGWAPHAWAEVYFPDVGWIPWDVTFGQYGWLDTGHVKLSESAGAKEPSVEYSWRSVKVALKDKDLKLNTSIVEKGDDIFPLVELDSNIIYGKVKGGSYVPFEVKVRNLQGYYLSTLVYLTEAPGVVGDNTQAVLLKPREEKSIFWLLKVPELNGDFTYKSGIGVGESFGGSSHDEILIDEDFDFYSEDKGEEYITRNTIVNKSSSGNFSIDYEPLIDDLEVEEEVFEEILEDEKQSEGFFLKLLRWLRWI